MPMWQGNQDSDAGQQYSIHEKLEQYFMADIGGWEWLGAMQGQDRNSYTGFM